MEGNDADAVQLVRDDVAAATGAEVVEMSVAQHDRVLAATSHLPHVLAYALVDALASGTPPLTIFSAAPPGGFRDFTRIASSDPVMWRDIALANRPRRWWLPSTFSEHSVCEHLRCSLRAVARTFERVKQVHGTHLRKFWQTFKRLRPCQVGT